MHMSSRKSREMRLFINTLVGHNFEYPLGKLRLLHKVLSNLKLQTLLSYYVPFSPLYIKDGLRMSFIFSLKENFNLYYVTKFSLNSSFMPDSFIARFSNTLWAFFPLVSCKCIKCITLSDQALLFWMHFCHFSCII